MNLLIIFLNRIYFFLKNKAKNETPFEASIGACSLFLCLFVYNLFLAFFFVNNSIMILPIWLGIIVLILVFVILFLYVKNKRDKIELEIIQSKKINLIVISFIIVNILVFIKLANINRDKIAKNKSEFYYTKPEKESLESEIRKLLK